MESMNKIESLLNGKTKFEILSNIMKSKRESAKTAFVEKKEETIPTSNDQIDQSSEEISIKGNSEMKSSLIERNDSLINTTMLSEISNKGDEDDEDDNNSENVSLYDLASVEDNDKLDNFSMKRERNRSSIALRGQAKKASNELENRAGFLKECSFHPQLSQESFSKNCQLDRRKMTVEERSLLWLKEKERLREKREEEILNTQLLECSFTPDLSSSTYYKDEDKDYERRKSVKEKTQELHNNQRHIAKKDTLVREYKEREEKNFKNTCTFHPSLETQDYHEAQIVPVKAKYYKGYLNTLNKDRKKPSPPPLSPECTFQPKTKQIKPAMDTTLSYLNEKVTERLYYYKSIRAKDDTDVNYHEQKNERRKSMGSYEEKEKENSEKSFAKDKGYVHDMNDAEFAGWLKEIFTKQEKKTRGKEESDISALSSKEKEERRKSFQDFINRLDRGKEKKDKRLKEIVKDTQPSFAPTFLTSKNELPSSLQGLSHIERLEYYNMKKESELYKAKHKVLIDKECTFVPQLTTLGLTHPSRSDEVRLSELDNKREKERTIKSQIYNEEMKPCTFQPVLNRNYSEVESKINVLKNGHTYIKRIKQLENFFDERRRSIIQNKERKEFEECTFSPEINTCPSFISELREAMPHKVKPVRNLNEKPDWR